MLLKWDKPGNYLSDQIGMMSNKKSCTTDLNLNIHKIHNSRKNFSQQDKENLSNTPIMTITGVMVWERDKIDLE